MNNLIVVDVEADGPIPPKYSMVSFAAVIVDKELNKTFYRRVSPISDEWDEETLKYTGCSSREEHMETGEPPEFVMADFAKWLQQEIKGQPVFITDNPAFDWQWVNYYFHTYYGSNPFGFSARRIGDLYCGLQRDMRSKWKHLRKTKHTHHPLDDAKGNAEALLRMFEMGLK
jgi:hypothetical protein